MPGGHREAGENILETAKRELQEETGAVKFEIKPICVYSVTGKNRVNDTGEETFGLLCFAEIIEFAKGLHSEMEPRKNVRKIKWVEITVASKV